MDILPCSLTGIAHLIVCGALNMKCITLLAGVTYGVVVPFQDNLGTGSVSVSLEIAERPFTLKIACHMSGQLVTAFTVSRYE